MDAIDKHAEYALDAGDLDIAPINSNLQDIDLGL